MILRVANKEITCLFRLVDRISVGTDKRARVYECYWAHFAAEFHLSE